MLIKLENISFSYDGSTKAEVLKSINLTFKQGEIVGILGKTGSGKSTLLQLCTGFLSPGSGEVEAFGNHINSSNDWQKFRKRIGFVFQFPEKQLFEESIYKDVGFGLSEKNLSEESKRDHICKALEKVGLEPDEFVESSPWEVSSGEQRKAAIAGIIVLEPEILFLDEPTLGLDGKSMIDLENIIRGYNRAGKTICIVSHNIDFLARLVDRIVLLSDKTIKFDGTKEDYFNSDELLRNTGMELPDIIKLKNELERKYDLTLKNAFTVDEILRDLREGVEVGSKK